MGIQSVVEHFPFIGGGFKHWGETYNFNARPVGENLYRRLNVFPYRHLPLMHVKPSRTARLSRIAGINMHGCWDVDEDWRYTVSLADVSELIEGFLNPPEFFGREHPIDRDLGHFVDEQTRIHAPIQV